MKGQRINILLIDDDGINNFLSRELITMYLPGTEVTAIADAEKALAFLNQHKGLPLELPDIILIDINMPLMDGWDFMKEIEQIEDPCLREIRIFLYTSSVYYGDIKKAESYPSVRNIYSKPLTQEMLMEIVDENKWMI